MFHKQFQKRLDNIYTRNSNDLVVVYGNRRTGLYDFINDFCQNKEWFYYSVPDVESDLQEKLFIHALNNKAKNLGYIKNDYESILLTYLNNSSNKKVIVFDEFSNLLQENSSYFNLLFNLVNEKCEKGSVLFILMSSDVKWIEKDMIDSLGRNAYEITEVINLNDSKFDDIAEYYNNVSLNDIFTLYTCIGVNCVLWNNVKDSYDFKNFLVNDFLNVNGIIFNEGRMILPKSFRQDTVYQTILYYLAKDCNTLNKLFEKTKMGRAKLSVYLKNLAEYGLVYKEELDTKEDKTAALKGIYRIRDPFVYFWFHFIFPNYSTLISIGSEKFFKKIIVPGLGIYLNYFYPEYCRYNLLKESKQGILPFEISSIDTYKDKTEIIDFIITDTDNNKIICICDIKSPHLSFKDFENVVKSTEKLNIKYDKIALFSAGGFDQKLYMSSKVNNNLLLFDGKDRWINRYS